MSDAYTDEEQAEFAEREERIKILRQMELEELRHLLGAKPGRYLIWRFLSECGVFQDGIGLPTKTLRERTGMKHIGLWIMNECFQASPNWYDLTRAEGAARDLEKEKASAE